jgi:hypothetical protein
VRYLCLLFLLPLLAGCDPYYPYGYGGYPAGYYSGPPPGYPGPQPYYGGPGGYSSENCGTPEQPKACPPLPRHPLPYYPANHY